MRSSIPTPTQSQIDIGPLTFHFYALCIIAGIALAIWLGDRRLRSYGNSAGIDLSGVVSEVAVIAVPAGIIGGRLYHVVTTPELYFGSSGDLLSILKIWQGGLGIWGAIALGVLGAHSLHLKSYWMPLPQEYCWHKQSDDSEIGLTPNYLADR
jgi:prolipoprotein diacylglyceryltransferase